MSIITIGIDLAKNIFAIHGVNGSGQAELVKPKVPREQLLPLIANLPPCLIGMEACSGAHHWARQFQQYGHTVRLIAPKFVTPYRMTGKRGKNDAADAAAICEAVTRPQMLFVPIKDEHQQATLTLHRTRLGFVEERTALYNRLRGLIAEFGIVLPQKVERLRAEIGAHLEDLPGWSNRCVGDMLVHADRLDERIKEYDKAITQIARDDARSKRCSYPASDRPPPARCWPASVVDMTSATDVRSQHGSDSCQANTAAVAKRDSDVHLRRGQLPAQPAGAGRTLSAEQSR